MECESFGQKLKSFRPNVSVFEAKVSKLKTKERPAEADAPREKRASIKVGAKLNVGAYRDPAFYINYERNDQHVESGFSVHSKLEGAVMDLVGEDQEGFLSQKRQYHWDKRSKKYICLPGSESVKGGKRVRTESGVKLSKKDHQTGKFYESWTKQQKTRIQSTGAVEDPKLVKQVSGALTDIGKRYKEKLKGGGAMDEEMNPDQIKKRKREQTKMKWKNMPKEKRAKIQKNRNFQKTKSKHKR